MPANLIPLILEGANGKIQLTNESLRIEMYKQKMFTLPPPKWDNSKISKTYDITRNMVTKAELANFLGTRQFHVYFPNAGLGGFINLFISNEQDEQAKEMLKRLTRIETSTSDDSQMQSNVLDAVGHSDPGPILQQGVEHRQANSMIKDISLEIKSTMVWDNKGANALGNLGEYDTAIEKNPQDSEAWRNKGTILHRQGKFDEAIMAYDMAIKINPQDANAWGHKGTVLDDLGKSDQAIKAYDKAIEINPQDADAWSNKGLNLYYQSNYDEAMHAIDMAIRINPQHASAWNNKGGILTGQGKYSEGIEAFDKAIEIDPKNANYWNSKCAALCGQNKYVEALNAVDEAIELDPNFENAQAAKRSILRKLGNFKTEDAITSFSEGVSLHDQGKYNEAIREYDEAIELDPTLAIEVHRAKNLALEMLENSKISTIGEQTPNVIEFDSCPVCKMGRLSVINKKKFLGLVTNHEVICNSCQWKMVDQHVKEFMGVWENQKNIAINTWLADIRRGQGFPIERNPPIMLKKNESSLFTLDNISLSENRSVRTGHYSSSRVRVAKGVSIGGGTFRSQSHEELTEIDNGTLTLTNQRIVFAGKSHSSDIPLKKIISIEPYRDGIVIRKEGRAKAQQFTGTSKSYLNITVDGRIWTIPMDGVIINEIVATLIR
jgi:tetratricopeptide (TPR) repeat protein